MRKLATALVALAAATVAVPAAAQTYDAFTGFTGNTNQFPNNGAANGNFIYGTVNQNTPQSGTFFTANTNCAIPGSTCLQSTTLGGNDSLPGVYKGGTSFSTVTVPTDRLLAHPGNNSDLTGILFVAPTAGYYRLYASFNTQDSNPSGIDLYRLGVQPNGAGPFTFNQLTSNSAAPFTDYRLVFLNASQAIGYGIGNGGSFFNDSTGVRFSVASGVPEPATWAMLIMGFGVVGFAMRRRTRTTVAYA